MPRGPLILAYAQLFRLPNVFTAAADVLLGILMARGRFEPGGAVALLAAGSCLMYVAGIVLNDVFDREVDAVERPHRPIPSGRIHPGFARTLGGTLLLAGAALGALSGAVLSDARPAIVAGSLAALIVLYDRFLKATALGPASMGGCRTLNVLLGLSAAAGPWATHQYVVAGGVGLYVAGLTWFARSEAAQSPRAPLVAGTATMTGGMALAASYPAWPSFTEAAARGAATLPADLWIVGWIVLAGTIVWRAVWAIAQPDPAHVQAAVRNGILSLIVIDAVLALPAAQSPLFPFAIAALLIPTRILGQYVYST